MVSPIKPQQLSWINSLKDAYKHFKYHKGRNALIIAGTAIGLFSVILFSGLGTGVNKYVDNQVNSLVNPTAITVTRHVKTSGNQQQQQQQQQQSLLSAASGGSTSKPFTNKDVQKIKKVAGVKSVQKLYIEPNVSFKYQGKTATASSVYSWTKASTKGSIKKGHAPKMGEVVLEKGTVAKQLKSKDYQKLLGKTVTITFAAKKANGQATTVHFKAKVAGFTDNSKSPMNYVNAKTLTKALQQADVTPNASMLAVNATSMNNSKQVAKRISKLKVNGTKQYSAAAISGMISQVQTYVTLISRVLQGIAAISLLVSALMIIVTMYMSVAERTREIGILRALGESKRDVRNLFISESLIIGTFSAIVATIVALLGEWGANAALSRVANFSFVQISVSNIIVVFIIALVISLLAAYLPARHAARLNPIDALSAD